MELINKLKENEFVKKYCGDVIVGIIICSISFYLYHKNEKINDKLSLVEINLAKTESRLNALIDLKDEFNSTTEKFKEANNNTSIELNKTQILLDSLKDVVESIKPDALGKILSPNNKEVIINKFNMDLKIKNVKQDRYFFVVNEKDGQYWPKAEIPSGDTLYRFENDKGTVPINSEFFVNIFEFNKTESKIVKSLLDSKQPLKTTLNGRLLDRIKIKTGNEKPFNVYSDKGIPNGDIWVWSGADWDLPKPTLIDGSYNQIKAPEGRECFAAKSGSLARNYVGWGVFLGSFNKQHELQKAHTRDLTSYSKLDFWVKSPVDLKVELQEMDDNGAKSSPCYISSYGWDDQTPEEFQRISIPINEFQYINFSKVFSPFMITGKGDEVTFYVDNVNWIL